MYRALIIDDEKPVRIVIKALGKWSSFGIDAPEVAFNGKEGLTVMREYQPNIVFVDMQMPIMSGMEFIEIASKEFEDVKFIVVSGYDDFHYAQSALRYGAIEYILKPVVEEELNEAIEKAIHLLNADRNIEIIQSIDAQEATAIQVVELMKDHIDKYYYEDFKITEFSDKYFFTKAYLSKLFKKIYHFGVYEYVLLQRMERAKELLITNELSIKEISERLGYNNNNYFSKAFKNHFNISPTDFKDSHK